MPEQSFLNDTSFLPNVPNLSPQAVGDITTSNKDNLVVATPRKGRRNDRGRHQQHRPDHPATSMRYGGLFRADIYLYSPERHTIEEKRDICGEITSSSKTMFNVMRVDFKTHPLKIRSKLLDTLFQPGIESLE